MLIHSQPIDPGFVEKMGLNDESKSEWVSDKNIKTQYIGDIFEDLLDGVDEYKIPLYTCLIWKCQRIRDMIYDFKYVVRNHRKWHKTLCDIRPWEGFDGLIQVMQTHLKDYLETEEKYGHSLEEYKKLKIQSVRDTLEVLERMKDPYGYWSELRNDVDARYPQYKALITKYEKGGTCVSGDFTIQGNGWVGMEGGKNPRTGYFEFIDGLFELAESPDQEETDRLLAEVYQYQIDIRAAYENAEINSEKDFGHLSNLLKENLYSWWD